MLKETLGMAFTDRRENGVVQGAKTNSKSRNMHRNPGGGKGRKGTDGAKKFPGRSHQGKKYKNDSEGAREEDPKLKACAKGQGAQ